MRLGMRTLMATAAVLCLGGLAACGNPNTVNNESAAANVSTVTETATATVQDPTTVTVTATPTESKAESTSTGGACTLADLSISLGEPSGAAGSTYYPLTFTNTSFKPCELSGFPQVAYVAGDDNHQVGGAAAEDGDKGAAVTIKPGQHAVANVQEVVVANFPEDVCKPTPVTGLRVSLPGETDDAAFVAQDGQTGCAAESLPGGQFQMSVQAMEAPTD